MTSSSGRPSADDPDTYADPLSEILSPSEDEPSKKIEKPSKIETREALEQAGPASARRLAQVVDHGDDKEAVSAATAVLDRIGFGKSESQPLLPGSSILPAQALVAALLGIGKVLGIREAEKLQEGVLIERKIIPEDQQTLPTSILKLASTSIHGSRVVKRASRTRKTEKKTARDGAKGS